MTTKEILDTVRARDMEIATSPTGLKLCGKTENATPTLVNVLVRHKKQLLEHFHWKPPEGVPVAVSSSPEGWITAEDGKTVTIAGKSVLVRLDEKARKVQLKELAEVEF